MRFNTMIGYMLQKANVKMCLVSDIDNSNHSVMSL